MEPNFLQNSFLKFIYNHQYMGPKQKVSLADVSILSVAKSVYCSVFQYSVFIVFCICVVTIGIKQKKIGDNFKDACMLSKSNYTVIDSQNNMFIKEA